MVGVHARIASKRTIRTAIALDMTSPPADISSQKAF
jgi:hypothetical protein